MKNFLLTIALFCLTLSAYSQDTSEVFDYGTCENNIYTNSYFKLKVTIPPSWTILSKKRADSIVSKGLNKIMHNNPSLKPMFKVKDIKDATLLIANEYKVTIPGKINPSVAITAENIIKFRKIKTGEDYLIEAKKLLTSTNIGYKLGKISKEKINGYVLYKFNAEVNTSTTKIKQDYYSIIVKGFSLSFILTYTSNKQKKDLLKILKSVEFSE